MNFCIVSDLGKIVKVYSQNVSWIDYYCILFHCNSIQLRH